MHHLIIFFHASLDKTKKNDVDKKKTISQGEYERVLNAID